MGEEIINKVESSGLITIDLGDFSPQEDILLFDIKPFLFREQIVKEKEFRESLKKADWSPYANKIAAIICSADAIVPAWAYMLIVTYLQPFATEIIMGDEKEAARQILLKKINQINPVAYTDKRIIIKGCGDTFIDLAAYVAITAKILPFAKSVMYGEACSNVPVYKKKS